MDQALTMHGSAQSKNRVFVKHMQEVVEDINYAIVLLKTLQLAIGYCTCTIIKCNGSKILQISRMKFLVDWQ